MKKVIDLSNYDADHDMAYSPMWAVQFIGAGVDGIIVGSQWPDKARWQIARANAASLPVLGTYAEPNYETAVELAQFAKCRYVGIACERGGIETTAQLHAAVDYVTAAGFIPLGYGNAGDWASISNGEFPDILRWLANYGTNDPNNPRPPIPGVAIHQYSSTIQIADRVRDHNYWMIPEEEPDMTPQEREDLKNLVAIMGGSAKIKDNAERGNDFILGYAIEQQKLGEHIADKAAHR